MTSFCERERQYYWHFAMELKAATASGDRAGMEDACTELEGIALHSGDPKLRRSARDMIEAARTAMRELRSA